MRPSKFSQKTDTIYAGCQNIIIISTSIVKCGGKYIGVQLYNSFFKKWCKIHIQQTLSVQICTPIKSTNIYEQPVNKS